MWKIPLFEILADVRVERSGKLTFVDGDLVVDHFPEVFESEVALLDQTIVACVTMTEDPEGAGDEHIALEGVPPLRSRGVDFVESEFFSYLVLYERAELERIDVGVDLRE